MIYEYNYIDEQGQEYLVEAELDVEFDANHGADADGNRGAPMYFLNDYTLNSYILLKDSFIPMFSNNYEDIKKEINKDFEQFHLEKALQATIEEMMCRLNNI